MTVEDAVLEKLKAMPTNRKQELLDFADSLVRKESLKRPMLNLYGILADLNTNITEEDIREMRREAWKNFPREHFFETEEK